MGDIRQLCLPEPSLDPRHFINTGSQRHNWIYRLVKNKSLPHGKPQDQSSSISFLLCCFYLWLAQSIVPNKALWQSQWLILEWKLLRDFCSDSGTFLFFTLALITWQAMKFSNTWGFKKSHSWILKEKGTEENVLNHFSSNINSNSFL